MSVRITRQTVERVARAMMQIDSIEGIDESADEDGPDYPGLAEWALRAIERAGFGLYDPTNEAVHIRRDPTDDEIS